MTKRTWKPAIILVAVLLIVLGFTFNSTPVASEALDASEELEALGCEMDYTSYLFVVPIPSGNLVYFRGRTELTGSGCQYSEAYAAVDCEVVRNGVSFWSDSHGSWDGNGTGFYVEVEGGSWYISSESEIDWVFLSECTHTVALGNPPYAGDTKTSRRYLLVPADP